jgi:hypothetical protein
MTSLSLKQIYETIILPQFDVSGDLTRLSWGDHTQLGPDAMAYRFTLGQDEYVLVFEDYPGLTEQEINQAIAPPEQYLSRQLLYGHSEETEYLHFIPGATPYRYIANVTGSFSLFMLLWVEREAIEIQPVSIKEVAENLLAIRQSISKDSTAEDIIRAGGMIMGQTSVNMAITIEDYTDMYPVLDRISAYAEHIEIGDGFHDTGPHILWNELAECIEAFYRQVQEQAT